jgi:hypothetical protein
MIYPNALQWLAEEQTSTQVITSGIRKKTPCMVLRFGVRRTHMDNQVPKYVTQERAALLLGIPEEELNRISSESELGCTERAGDQEETFFTYEELRQICLLSTHRLTRARF